MTARLLGPADEPDQPGAVAVVHLGDYRRQEVWVNSGANVGEWYCLGGEFGVPPVWDAPTDPLGFQPRVQRPRGTVPRHPTFADVLARGPVTLLVAGGDTAYRTGWRNGRRALWNQMEEAIYDDPPPAQT